MKNILIRNIPDKLQRRFKTHCASVDMTQNEALLRLMELEAESKIVACPVDMDKKK